MVIAFLKRALPLACEPPGEVPAAVDPDVGEFADGDPAESNPEVVDPELVDPTVGELVVELPCEPVPFTRSVLRLIVTLASPKRTLMTPVTSKTIATTTRNETDRDPGRNFFAARRR